MKNIKLITAFLMLALIFTGCTENDYEFGDITAPTALKITAQIVGATAANPYGDGSGKVNFTATADNAITYKFIYDGKETLAPAGTTSYNFGVTGRNKYTVTAVAIGTGGVTSSSSVEVEVLALYAAPADLLKMLVGTGSRSWKIKSTVAGHFGIGAPDAMAPIWYAAAPGDKEGLGMYDDVMTFSSNATYRHETNGNVLGKDFALNGDFGAVAGFVADGNGDIVNYPLASYSETWSLSAPGGQETLTISNKGFIGFYTASHTFQILSRSENEMRLRAYDPVTAGGCWWYYILEGI